MALDEQPTAVTPTMRPRKEKKDRWAAWILGSVTVGFLLPVCACAMFFFGSLSCLGSLDASGMASALELEELGPAVAIVRVEGVITHTDDEDSLNGAASGRVVADLRQAEADDNVKAIVLRVDSPGGTVTGSAQIYEVIRDEVTKPVVVSMFGTAASGGYYVSAPADYIFARPDTTTGSLGVIITLFNAEGLLEEIGVEVINVTSGENKAIGSPWDEFTEQERAIFEEMIEESYTEFVDIIATGRNLPDAAVREMADGRIYTGRQALALGLVDELGNFEDAIAKAADLGGISGEPRRVEYERLPSLEDFLVGFNGRMNQSDVDEVLATVYETTAPVVEYRYLGK